jgi:hypothetical protein
VPHDLGVTVRLTAECRDPGGTLTTAGTVAVTVTLPDGTTATPAAVETATTGRYQADYLTTQAGRHTVRWTFTDPATAYTDAFDVREETPPAILSLADAKEHLNITSSTHDEELRGWIEATTHCVEWFVGPVVQRTVTEVHSATVSAAVALRQTPVIAVTGVEPVLTSGTTYEVAEFDVDPATGVVTLLTGAPIYGPLRWTYTAGRTVIPANILGAARIILQHLWRTQQGPSRPQLGVGDFDVTEPIPGLGYAVPNRALQLLDPHRLPPGVA